MSTNSNNESQTTIESNESSPFQALQNQIEVLREQYQGFGIEDAYARKVLGEVQDLVTAIREDYEFNQEQETTIEGQYQTIQRDVFLKWDRLEQQKSELRENIEEIHEVDGTEVRLGKYYINLFENTIEAIEEYQDDLETAMSVLEFEESQHDDGIR